MTFDWLPWFLVQAAALYCGYVCYVVGIRLGELSYVAPFKYSSVLLAIAFGYIIWGETPTPIMFIGAAIIVFSGVVLLASEKSRRRKLSLDMAKAPIGD